MTDLNLEKHALTFATEVHRNQRRRYTNEPYIVHSIAVAELVRTVPHTDEMIAAALLHDVVEDTPTTLPDLHQRFGTNITQLVAWLTDVSTPFHGNRETRKELDRLHISLAPPEAQTIKLADLIHNCVSIRENDPAFWRVYRHEKARLLEVLHSGHPHLMARAISLVSAT